MPATKYGLDPQVEITPEEIKRLLQPPSHFAYWGDDKDKMFVTWTLGPTIRHRDSGITDRSNARVLIKHLESDPTLGDDWRITNASHCMVGWVDHLSYRVKDEDGKPSRVARVIKAFYDALDDYPIANEDDHSALQCEESDRWIEQDGPRVAERLGYTLPEDWQWKVMDWWGEHRSNATEDRDDTGASPDEEDYRVAFEALGFVKTEE